MSSRFVSGGTLPGDTSANTAPTETSNPAPAATGAAPKGPQQQPQQPIASTTTNASTSTNSSKNAAEWARVQAELDAARAQREATRRANTEGGAGEEKSLFEVLQANKAAKQAAFEEASRLRNQFRALDDDEVDFLDEVQEKERQEEERKRLELEEGLGKFRQAQRKPTATTGQNGGDQSGQEEVVEEEDVAPTEDLASEWIGATAGGAGRKRKREKEVLFKGLKRKSTSEGGAQEKGATKSADTNDAAKTAPQAPSTNSAPMTKQTAKPPVAASKLAAPKPATSLVAYGSDDDDDDDD